MNDRIILQMPKLGLAMDSVDYYSLARLDVSVNDVLAVDESDALN